MIVLRILGGLFAAVVALAAAYIVFALVAWRDLPVADLEERYGGATLPTVAPARTATIDGVPIRYRFDEHAERPPIVLVHNHFFDMGMWDGWMPLLRPNYSVLRYDLSGHGLTGPDPSGIYTVERDVDLLLGLLDHLDIDTFSLVGSSLGGNIAIRFAAAHPDRVTGLVLVNSGGLKRPGSRTDRRMPAWGGLVLRLLPPAALHAFVRWIAADSNAVDEALLTRFVDLWRREGNRRAEFERLRQFTAGGAEPLLAKITAPTLVLWGERNPQLPVALAQTFRDQLTASPRVEVKTYSGAGHLLPVERPRTSAADTIVFLLAKPPAARTVHDGLDPVLRTLPPTKQTIRDAPRPADR